MRLKCLHDLFLHDSASREGVSQDAPFYGKATDCSCISLQSLEFPSPLLFKNSPPVLCTQAILESKGFEFENGLHRPKSFSLKPWSSHHATFDLIPTSIQIPCACGQANLCPSSLQHKFLQADIWAHRDTLNSPRCQSVEWFSSIIEWGSAIFVPLFLISITCHCWQQGRESVQDLRGQLFQITFQRQTGICSQQNLVVPNLKSSQVFYYAGEWTENPQIKLRVWFLSN